MELKEYLQIIKKYRDTFFTVWGVILFLALFTVFVQPVIYEGEKTMFVVRTNKDAEVAVSREYDYYYQMEVDGKLGNMLIGLLKDKYLLERSFHTSGEVENKIKNITVPKNEKAWIISNLKGEVLESGYIKIKISSHNRDIIEQMGNQLARQFKIKISKIGTDKKRLIELEVEPVIIIQKDKPYLLVGIGAFFSGLLAAIFTTLGIYYWKDGE